MKNYWIQYAGLCLTAALMLTLSGCVNWFNVAPTVFSTTPQDGATGVAIDTLITTTFSEAVQPALVNTTTFTLVSGGSPVQGSVSFIGLTATFAPTAPLQPDTVYTATINQGIKDLEGRPLATNHSWTFTTAPPVPTVHFAATSQAVDEGVGSVTITVILSTTTSQSVTVPFLVSGTASPADHDLLEGTITVPAGSLSAEIMFGITNDALDETNETVILTLGAPTNATLGANTRHTVTIGDNDAPTVNWAVNGQTVNETVACPCDVTIQATLSSTTTLDVTVPYTVTGTATPGSDFNPPTPDPLVITAGDLTALITLTVLDDVQTESSEFVIFTMGTPTNAVSGSTVQHSVEILSDE